MSRNLKEARGELCGDVGEEAMGTGNGKCKGLGGSQPGTTRRLVGLEGIVRRTVGGSEGREGMGQGVQSFVGHREDCDFCFE